MTNTIVEKLYLMQVASAPPMMGSAPFVCYLIQTDDKNILVDSGFPAPEQLLPGFAPEFGKDVIEQLASIGLHPDNIDILICSHFDSDHCGHHPAFTRAKFVVQRVHYDYAQKAQRFAFMRPFWDVPVERYQFVEGDTQLLPGIDLIATDGHTRGHQSLLVHLPETGAVILAIDAVVRQDNFTPDVIASPRDEDEQALRASTRKLIDLAEREHVSLVIFGHDMEQWADLKKLPDFYA